MLAGVSNESFLAYNTTINSEVFWHQLHKLNDSLKRKRSVRVLTEVCNRILPYPPYSPGLAPSDYYLFRCLQNFLDGRITS